MYMISNYGRVYCKRGYMVSSFINRNGYIECKLDEHNELVHRLVAITFIPNIKFMELDVNHKDGIKYNNHVSNLEWVNRSENIIHAFNNNLSKKGEEHPNSIYSNADIEFICRLLERGYKAREISECLNIPCTSSFRKFISKIVHKKVWKHISCKYNIRE